jgi:hypothetical protein
MRTTLATFIAANLKSRLLRPLLLIFAAPPYRPEKYYMRGPGPQWNAKHNHGLR